MNGDILKKVLLQLRKENVPRYGIETNARILSFIFLKYLGIHVKDPQSYAEATVQSKLTGVGERERSKEWN